MLKRLNTGYHDGDYSVPAGHIEPQESALVAGIREASEEVGVTLTPSDLTIVHVMHRKASAERVDFFLHVTRWNGEIRNCEPEKCATLQWFPIRDLPENTIPYIRRAIRNFQQGRPFDLFGWDSTEHE